MAGGIWSGLGQGLSNLAGVAQNYSQNQQSLKQQALERAFRDVQLREQQRQFNAEQARASHNDQYTQQRAMAENPPSEGPNLVPPGMQIVPELQNLVRPQMTPGVPGEIQAKPLYDEAPGQVGLAAPPVPPSPTGRDEFMLPENLRMRIEELKAATQGQRDTQKFQQQQVLLQQRQAFQWQRDNTVDPVERMRAEASMRTIDAHLLAIGVSSRQADIAQQRVGLADDALNAQIQNMNVDNALAVDRFKNPNAAPNPFAGLPGMPTNLPKPPAREPSPAATKPVTRGAKATVAPNVESQARQFLLSKGLKNPNVAQFLKDHPDPATWQ